MSMVPEVKFSKRTRRTALPPVPICCVKKVLLIEGGGVTVSTAVLLGLPATASPVRVTPLVVFG